MVGGTVIEVCDHPSIRNRIYVNVADRPHGRIEECAVYLESTDQSRQIQIGDALWWQGSFAMWTPVRNRVSGEEAKKRNLRCGIDYDIRIPRIGYSGVRHPVRQCPECEGRGPGYCPVCRQRR